MIELTSIGGIREALAWVSTKTDSDVIVKIMDANGNFLHCYSSYTEKKAREFGDKWAEKNRVMIRWISDPHLSADVTTCKIAYEDTYGMRLNGREKKERILPW